MLSFEGTKQANRKSTVVDSRKHPCPWQWWHIKVRQIFYLQSLGWCEIISCVSELIMLFSVAFRIFFRSVHMCDFKFITF